MCSQVMFCIFLWVFGGMVLLVIGSEILLRIGRISRNTADRLGALLLFVWWLGAMLVLICAFGKCGG